MSVARRLASLSRLGDAEVLALCISNTVSGCESGTIPLWIAAVNHSKLLSATLIGWLASGELMLMAASALSVSIWGQRMPPRSIAAPAAFSAMAGNTIAMIPTIPTFVMGRLLSGAAVGALQACATGVAARRPDAQRVLSLMQAALVLLGSGVIFLASQLIDRYGSAGLFAIAAILCSVALLTSARGLSGANTPSPQRERHQRGLQLAPVLGCFGIGMTIFGQNLITAYLVTIGQAAGIETSTLGSILATSVLVGVMGPIIATWLGERLGLMKPLTVGLLLMSADVLLLVSARAPLALWVTTAFLITCTFFCIPYAIGLVSRLDRSGGYSSAAPAFMMIGGALSPAAGSTFVISGRFVSLAAASAISIVASILLYFAAALLQRSTTHRPSP